MKCEFCGRGIEDGVKVLHRINAKGIPAKVACEEHYKQSDAPPIDPEVKHITDILTGRAS